ncbi:MAG: hypothetical protein GKR99_14835 [Rhodobacteraceae bacterium]|nr:hypothetical protein [Paracoccaceae bacterium]
MTIAARLTLIAAFTLGATAAVSVAAQPDAQTPANTHLAVPASQVGG